MIVYYDSVWSITEAVRQGEALWCWTSDMSDPHTDTTALWECVVMLLKVNLICMCVCMCIYIILSCSYICRQNNIMSGEYRKSKGYIVAQEQVELCSNAVITTCSVMQL